jgi:menaquinone-dependent protoporphyrinogen IX oxidase
MGKVVADVVMFVRGHRTALAMMPVAAFTVGIASVGNKTADIENAMKIFHQALAPLEPVAETIFAGKWTSRRFLLFRNGFGKRQKARSVTFVIGRQSRSGQEICPERCKYDI